MGEAISDLSACAAWELAVALGALRCTILEHLELTTEQLGERVGDYIHALGDRL